jgi:uncharacterized repeat protein (TIGR01451 family)/MYXO-CTERM domain-containing protein
MHSIRGASFATIIALVFLAAPAGATSFSKGALIIPMDTTYQDNGMFKAYGLVYKLLQANIPVHWVIKKGKKVGDADFSVASTDFKTAAKISSHGYRSGPFVIQASNAAKAKPLISAWQAKHVTTVHVAAASFTGRTGRVLTAAPSLTVIADGQEAIAVNILNAAGIPNPQGRAWTVKDPDVVTPAQVAGPTTSKHNDGALFTSSGQPAYCQVMTMHWDVAKILDEVVAEYRQFLSFPTHVFAQCQAVNAIENHKNGHFLTPHGFIIDNKTSGTYTYLNSDIPFAQLDGTFALVGGSEKAFTLPAGDKYYDVNVVMITDGKSGVGKQDIWMTGYLDGKCKMSEPVGGGTAGCLATVGKVSYLGGHQYDLSLPISKNPKSQGSRLFLNSLFEAECAVSSGQPDLVVTLSGPTATANNTVTYTLTYNNRGTAPALGVILSYSLPAGASYVSSTGSGSLSGGTVTWKAGDVPAGASGSVTVTISFSKYGTYTSKFDATFRIGTTPMSKTSNTLNTTYQKVVPDAGPPRPDTMLYRDGQVPSPDASSGPDLGATDVGQSDRGAQDLGQPDRGAQDLGQPDRGGKKDTDGDGIPDDVEDKNGNGKVDPGETDPTKRDTDGDGLDDGVEDANKNGKVDPGETDPTKRDTDGDGLVDGWVDKNGDGKRTRDEGEDLNGNGKVDDNETDPRKWDTDDGGEPDGSEVNRGANPLNPADDLGKGTAIGGGGCDCRVSSPASSVVGPLGSLGLLVMLALMRRRRRRRRR